MKKTQIKPKGYTIISNCKTCGAPILMETKKWKNPAAYITQKVDGSFQLDGCVYTCNCCRFNWSLGTAIQPYSFTYATPNEPVRIPGGQPMIPEFPSPFSPTVLPIPYTPNGPITIYSMTTDNEVN